MGGAGKGGSAYLSFFCSPFACAGFLCRYINFFFFAFLFARIFFLSFFLVRFFLSYIVDQGMKLTFFSRSHLAPKFFKVVANSKKLVAIFKDKQIFFYAVSVLDRPSKMKLTKRSLISAIQIEESLECPKNLHWLQSGH